MFIKDGVGTTVGASKSNLFFKKEPAEKKSTSGLPPQSHLKIHKGTLPDYRLPHSSHQPAGRCVSS